MRHALAILAGVATLSAISAARASAPATLILSGAVDQVAAADDLAAAVRGGTVLLLTAQGNLFGRIGDRGLDPSDTEPAPGADQARRNGILDLFGIDDADRRSRAADDLVEDELGLRDRRQQRGAARAIAVARRPLVAAAGKLLWILLDGQLWRASREQGVHRISRPTARPDLMAATADGTLVVTAGRSLLISSDGGASFAPITVLPETPSRLAIAADGSAIVWASAGAIHLRAADDGGAPLRFDVASGVLDVRFCGGTAFALAEAGLFAAVGQRRAWRKLAARPEARVLACDADSPGPIVALDPGVLLSADGGATWHEHEAAPPTRTIAGAVGASAIWLATPAGLFAVALDANQSAVASGVDVTAASAVMVAPVLARRPPAYAAWLPRLMVRGTVADAPGRREIRAVALADFPLGSGTARMIPPPPRPRFAVLQGDPAAPPASPALAAPGPRYRPLSASESQCLGDVRLRAVKLAMAEPERARSYVNRAGYAAWLPEVHLRVDRRLGRSESLDFKNGGVQPSSPLGLDTANDVRYEARATWDLAKLVFSTEELAAESQALHMADLRRDLESLANRLFFERRRLMMETAPVADRSADLRRAVRIEELDAELDALSGGFFTTCRREAVVP